jgi:hypothetical protein
MKSIIAAMVVGLFVSTAAHSECVMRTSSLTKVVGKLSQIADIRPMVSPSFNGELKCSVSVRVEYKGQWFTAYGDYTGDPQIGQDELCVNAVEIAARQFLASKEAKLLHSDQQMICSDEPAIKQRSVEKGEIIRLSEITLHPDKRPFTYKGTECKWFIETTVVTNDLYQWNGVVCKTSRPGSDDWTVVEKF